ncbi:glycine cleavage system T protein [Pleurotus eryngii]|uniref:Aminomethyltransferase n=1 Tax=Pleurotus eryngii TaxID=5323 RepID=A0A9P6D265_PLEER|nr:glycine cleavage system T protein [Pleurotus eryngii]
MNTVSRVSRLSRSLARPFATQAEQLRQTPLHDFHVQNAAKMVPFAGWSMPLSYGDVGQVASHNHTRTAASLFDVSHMLQSHFRGPGATAFLEKLTPSCLSSLKPYTSTLSVLLNEDGGIIDDMIITKHAEDAYYVVTNAGRRDRDMAWFKERLKDKEIAGKVDWEVLDGWGLLALQGPQAASFLQSLTSFDLRQLTFGRTAYIPIEGFNLHVARGGYTGEDGFEISIPPNQTLAFTELVYKNPPVQLCGLGARDSLRIEAGMCLYGHDIDETTSVAEAGLSWVIGKSRKENINCIGAHRILKDIKNGPPRRRVGMIVEGAPAREGAKIFTPESNDQLGVVTSGIPSPTLGKNVAMGYVRNGSHKKGTELEVDIRGKRRRAVIAGMPFVESRYFRG